MAIKIEKPRGTRDILPEISGLYHSLEMKARDIFARYRYEELKTPVFESVELFKRSIGDATDIVEKEMYVFEDRKGRRLALRPEGTAGIARAYIENNLESKCSVSKLFYIGPMFRYERPQTGRYREFYQIGAEYIGDSSPLADAEVISVLMDVLKAACGGDLNLVINSLGCAECRPAYRTALIEALKSKLGGMCEDCVKRFDKNPLRVLDCKVDGKHKEDLPRLRDYLCASCSVHFERLKSILGEAGFGYTRDDYLVRGLDYYTRTIFEIKSKALSETESTVAAGGRYDNLVEQLGGRATPACGFALGVERVVSAMANDSESVNPQKTVFLAVADNKAEARIFGLKRRLAEKGLSVTGPFSDRSLKSQMRLADSMNAGFAVIVGENETRDNTVVLRDMKEKTQKTLTEKEILSELQAFK